MANHRPLGGFRDFFSLGHSSYKDALKCIIILLFCSALGYLFYKLRLSEANIITIYILGILLISSLTNQRIFGVLSCLVGVLLFNFLFAEPRFNFFYVDPQYSITAVIMLAATLATNHIMSMLKLRLEQEKQETFRSEVLLELSQKLQQAETLSDIFTITLGQVQKLCGSPALIFVLEPHGGISAPLSSAAAGIAAPGERQRQNVGTAVAAALRQPAQPATPTLIRGETPFLLLRLQAQDKLYALVTLLLSKNRPIARFEQNLAFSMLEESALAVEKYYLHQSNEAIARQAEAERLRANLLRTISHDLRSPLTSISGNADILLHSHGQIEPALKQQLYQNIYDDAQWLIDLVENLLFITRLENGAMTLHPQAEVLQEIISEALRHLHNRSKNHLLHMDMTEELLLVSVDARLLLQVIINLVDNALKYSPPGSAIHIRAGRHGTKARVEIADHGPGIAAQDKQLIFQTFYTANKPAGDSRRGIGLGLSLCQSIVQAHGGSIEVHDNQPQGSIFAFALDLVEVNYDSDHSGN